MSKSLQHLRKAFPFDSHIILPRDHKQSSTNKWQTNPNQVPSAPPSQPLHPSTNPSPRKTSRAYKRISSRRASPPRQLPSQPQRLFQTSSLYLPSYATSSLPLHQQRASIALSARSTKSLPHRLRKTSKHLRPRDCNPSRINCFLRSSPLLMPLRPILPVMAPYGMSSMNCFRRSIRS